VPVQTTERARRDDEGETRGVTKVQRVYNGYWSFPGTLGGFGGERIRGGGGKMAERVRWAVAATRPLNPEQSRQKAAN
jgi:hypothetical protein